jgi:hypothetical protein
MCARVCFLGVSATLLLFVSTHHAREWTDNTGNFKVQADFVDFKGGKVRLKTEDGRLISLAIEKLSEADQAYVNSRTTGSGDGRDTLSSRSPSEQGKLKNNSPAAKKVQANPRTRSAQGGASGEDGYRGVVKATYRELAKYKNPAGDVVRGMLGRAKQALDRGDVEGFSKSMQEVVLFMQPTRPDFSQWIVDAMKYVRVDFGNGVKIIARDFQGDLFFDADGKCTRAKGHFLVCAIPHIGAGNIARVEVTIDKGENRWLVDIDGRRKNVKVEDGGLLRFVGENGDHEPFILGNFRFLQHDNWAPTVEMELDAVTTPPNLANPGAVSGIRGVIKHAQPDLLLPPVQPQKAAAPAVPSQDLTIVRLSTGVMAVRIDTGGRVAVVDGIIAPLVANSKNISAEEGTEIGGKRFLQKVRFDVSDEGELVFHGRNPIRATDTKTNIMGAFQPPTEIGPWEFKPDVKPDRPDNAN